MKKRATSEKRTKVTVPKCPLFGGFTVHVSAQFELWSCIDNVWAGIVQQSASFSALFVICAWANGQYQAVFFPVQLFWRQLYPCYCCIITDEEINKFDLPDILNLLRPVSKRWREIGTALLVKKTSLDDFENNPELVKEGLEGFLRETLNAVENLTVKALASALRSPPLQEEEIALQLEKYIPGGKGKDTSVYFFIYQIVFTFYRRF